MRLTVILLGLAAAAGAWGQTCSSATIRGTYGLLCTGYVTPAPNAPQVTFSAIGTVTGTWGANFSGNAKVSIGGAILNQTVTGNAAVNGDCTGTISYSQTINGQPGPPINLTFQILDEGKEIRGMSTDAGSTMTCSLRLMSR